MPVGAHHRIYAVIRRCLTLKDLCALASVDRSYPEFCEPLLEDHEPEREPPEYGPPPEFWEDGQPIRRGGDV